MLDFIANNALLAPLPVSVLISAFLILLILVFWIIPLEKRVKRAESQLLKFRKDIRAASNMQGDSVRENQPRDFSYLYKQNLSGDANTEGKAFNTLNQNEQPENSYTGLGKKSMQRRDRINKT